MGDNYAVVGGKKFKLEVIEDSDNFVVAGGVKYRVVEWVEEPAPEPTPEPVAEVAPAE